MNHYEPAESDDRPDRCRMITTDELTEAIPEFEWDRGFTEHIVDTLMLLCHDKSLPGSTVDRLEDFVYICADKTLVYEEIGHHNCRNACKSSRRECSELRTCRGIVWSDGIDIRSGENKFGELLFYRDGTRIKTDGKYGKVVFTVEGSIPLPILIWISVLD